MNWTVFMFKFQVIPKWQQVSSSNPALPIILFSLLSSLASDAFVRVWPAVGELKCELNLSKWNHLWSSLCDIRSKRSAFAWSGVKISSNLTPKIIGTRGKRLRAIHWPDLGSSLPICCSVLLWRTGLSTQWAAPGSVFFDWKGKPLLLDSLCESPKWYLFIHLAIHFQ